MREKHLVLRDNIGTFAKEDDAFNLLTKLSWQLPIFVVVSAILDLVLAVVYLKWLHPWKIILQKTGGNFPPYPQKQLYCCVHKIYMILTYAGEGEDDN